MMSLARLVSPLVLGASLVAVPPTQHRAPVRGFTYEFTQRTHSVNSNGTPHDDTLRTHVQVFGDNSWRMDVLVGPASPMFSAGDYAFSSAGKVFVIAPSTNEYMELGADMGVSERLDFMRSRGMDLTLTDGSVVFDSVPGTEVIAGHRTRHYRVTRSGTMSMETRMGVLQTSYESTVDYFVASDHVPSISATADPEALSRGPLSGLVSPHQFEQTREDIVKMHGFTMRRVTHSTVKGNGVSREATVTAEVTDLKEADVEPMGLTPPAGYTKVTLAARMQRMMGG